MSNLIQTLQDKIYSDIPLTKHMGIQVAQYTPQRLILSAPLENNINHRQSAFGGSITSLATLACWGLIYLELYQLHLPARIVIQDGATKYLNVINTNFSAECSISNPEQLATFIKTLQRKGVARIELQSQVTYEGILGATFSGHFVAKKY